MIFQNWKIYQKYKIIFIFLPAAKVARNYVNWSILFLNSIEASINLKHIFTYVLVKNMLNQPRTRLTKFFKLPFSKPFHFSKVTKIIFHERITYFLRYETNYEEFVTENDWIWIIVQFKNRLFFRNDRRHKIKFVSESKTTFGKSLKS